jgi:hypothetical protein
MQVTLEPSTRQRGLRDEDAASDPPAKKAARRSAAGGAAAVAPALVCLAPGAENAGVGVRSAGPITLEAAVLSQQEPPENPPATPDAVAGPSSLPMAMRTSSGPVGHRAQGRGHAKGRRRPGPPAPSQADGPLPDLRHADSSNAATLDATCGRGLGAVNWPQGLGEPSPLAANCMDPLAMAANCLDPPAMAAMEMQSDAVHGPAWLPATVVGAHTDPPSLPTGMEVEDGLFCWPREPRGGPQGMEVDNGGEAQGSSGFAQGMDVDPSSGWGHPGFGNRPTHVDEEMDKGMEGPHVDEQMEEGMEAPHVDEQMHEGMEASTGWCSHRATMLDPNGALPHHGATPWRGVVGSQAVETTGAGGWTPVETPARPPARAPTPPAGEPASNGGDGPVPALSGRGLSGFTIPCAKPRKPSGQPNPGNVFEAAEPADPKRIRGPAGGPQSSFTPSGDGCTVVAVRLAVGLCCVGLWGCCFVVTLCSTVF